MSDPIQSIKKSPFSPAILSGVLLVLIQPPVSLSFLAFFAFIPLFYSLEKAGLRESFFRGWVTGVVSFLGLLYWVIVAVHKYGGINIYLSFLILMLLVVYMAVYTGCFTLVVSYCEKRFSLPFYITAPPVWVLVEYLRGTLLTGFPWSYLSHSQYNFLPFIQVISFTGAYFISFLIVAVNGLLFMLLKRKRVSFVYAGIICALLALSLTYGFIKLRTLEPGPLKAAIVQGNITQDMKWDEAFKLKIINTYYQATMDSTKGSNLVVWPETAMPLIFDQEEHVRRYIRALPSLTGSYLLFGTISRDTMGKFRNSAYVLGPHGHEEGGYSKTHLVPFGEYTPLRAYLPFLERLSVQIGEFFPGQSPAPIRTGMGNIGVLICYEGVFPGITNEEVRRGAQVLVNITNDAWYDRTSAPYQHFAFYIFRAIESDRWVLRSANTGISAIIDSSGRVRGKTAIFQPAVLTGGFALKDTTTFYVRHGDYFVFVMLLLLAGAITTGLLKQRRNQR